MCRRPADRRARPATGSTESQGGFGLRQRGKSAAANSTEPALRAAPLRATRCTCSGNHASRQQPRRDVEQQRDGQPDHVPVVTIDRRSPAPRRGPGPRRRRHVPRHSPLRQVPVDQLGVERAEGDRRCAPRRSLGASPSCSSATPLKTSCVRPERRSRMAPRLGLVARPCRTGGRRGSTSVSTPSTSARARRARPRAPCAARSRAPRRAGSPSRCSSTSAGTTSNGMPSWSRIALRCGERDARTSCRRYAELGEPQPDLALGGVVGVRAVHEVERDLEREVAADRARAPPRSGWSRRSPSARPGPRPRPPAPARPAVRA